MAATRQYPQPRPSRKEPESSPFVRDKPALSLKKCINITNGRVKNTKRYFMLFHEETGGCWGVFCMFHQGLNWPSLSLKI